VSRLTWIPIYRPERGGPFPAIFFFMDAHGIREELRDMSRRLATVGYYKPAAERHWERLFSLYGRRLRAA